MKNYYVDFGVVHGVQVQALEELHELLQTASSKRELKEQSSQVGPGRAWRWLPAALLFLICAVPLVVLIAGWALS